MTPRSRQRPHAAPTAQELPMPGDMVVVGKDVLELLSSAMYVEPLSIYREYVQNAADAIDEARTRGWLGPETPGVVVLSFDTKTRTVRIRDNGAGIPVAEAAARLLAIGASAKRGTPARGFRGVGRLAGLAYARQLIFRTRSKGDGELLTLKWDCLRLKAALREVGQDDGLPGVLNRIVHIERTPASPEDPAHFFEVELNEVIRHHRRDALLNEDMVAAYLAEVAPVPLAEEFQWREEIVRHLAPKVRMGDLEVRVGERAPLRRPLGDRFPVSDTAEDVFTDLELISFDGRDGEVAAVGWLLHHNYLGALPERARIKGLRMRCGNVQVGESHIMEASFPEPRFNAWTVGEIHVLDPRIIPNARRDNFEQNVHFADLTAQVEPIGRRIARRCRSASIERNRARSAVTSTTALATGLKDGAAAPAAVTLLPNVEACASALRAAVKEFVPAIHRDALLAGLGELSDAVAELKAKDPIETLESFVAHLAETDSAASIRMGDALARLAERHSARSSGKA